VYGKESPTKRWSTEYSEGSPAKNYLPSMPRIILPDDDEALLGECDFEAHRASGKGGQHINKTDSAVRLHHRPTGITVTSQESRSQWQNRLHCLTKIREKVAVLNFVVKPRKATKKSKSAKRNILEEKAKHSAKKKTRSAKDWD
jgi:protein subunit release factor B